MPNHLHQPLNFSEYNKSPKYSELPQSYYAQQPQNPISNIRGPYSDRINSMTNYQQQNNYSDQKQEYAQQSHVKSNYYQQQPIQRFGIFEETHSQQQSQVNQLRNLSVTDIKNNDNHQSNYSNLQVSNQNHLRNHRNSSQYKPQLESNPYYHNYRNSTESLNLDPSRNSEQSSILSITNQRNAQVQQSHQKYDINYDQRANKEFNNTSNQRQLNYSGQREVQNSTVGNALNLNLKDIYGNLTPNNNPRSDPHQYKGLTTNSTIGHLNSTSAIEYDYHPLSNVKQPISTQNYKIPKFESTDLKIQNKNHPNNIYSNFMQTNDLNSQSRGQPHQNQSKSSSANNREITQGIKPQIMPNQFKSPDQSLISLDAFYPQQQQLTSINQEQFNILPKVSLSSGKPKITKKTNQSLNVNNSQTPQSVIYSNHSGQVAQSMGEDQFGLVGNLQAKRSRNPGVNSNINTVCVSSDIQAKMSVFSNDDTRSIDQEYQSINKTILIISTLCQTYNKDKIFASSIQKLVNELKDQIVVQSQNHNKSSIDDQKLQTHNTHALLKKIDDLEQKKKYYKNMAKSMKGDIQNYKSKAQQVNSTIEQRDNEISHLRKQISELELELAQQKGQLLEVSNEKQKITSIQIKKYQQNSPVQKGILDSQQWELEQSRQSSFQNQNFKQLVNECDLYIIEKEELFSPKTQGIAVNENLLSETLQMIRNNSEVQKLFQKYFQQEQNLKPQNFNQLLQFIQDLVKLTSLNYSDTIFSPKAQKFSTPTSSQNARFNLRNNPFDTADQSHSYSQTYQNQMENQQYSGNAITMENIQDMKDRLLQEITEQLDAKVQSRIQQTLLDQSSFNSDSVEINLNKNHGSVTKEDIQREILAILKEQNLLKPKVVQKDCKNKTYSQINENRKQIAQKLNQVQTINPNHASCLHSNTSTQQHNQSQTQSKPQIRQKTLNQSGNNNNSSQKTLQVNKGTDTHLDKSPEISVNLQRENRRGSFLMGCDGQAAVFYNQSNMDDYEMQFQQMNQTNQKSPSQKLISQSKTINTPKNQTLTFQKISDQDNQGTVKKISNRPKIVKKSKQIKQSQDDLIEKLNQAESKLMNSKNDNSVSQSNTRIHNETQNINYEHSNRNQEIVTQILQNQFDDQEETKQKNQEVFDMAQSIILDDENLLSDLDLQRNSNMNTVQTRNTANFNTENSDLNNKSLSHVPQNDSDFQQQQEHQFNTIVLVNQKMGFMMQPKDIVIEVDDSAEQDSNLFIQTSSYKNKNTITPTEQKSKDFNRFGFRNRQNTQSNNQSVERML